MCIFAYISEFQYFNKFATQYIIVHNIYKHLKYNKINMNNKLQERYFLLLKDDKESQILKKILKSPLGLAKELIIKLNENNYTDLKDNLDKIKRFVAGIERAVTLKDYKLANFYPTMFAFHQYFNSSFRARQGKVLEAVIQKILENYTDSNIVPDKVFDMQMLIKDIFKLPDKPSLDIDALGKDDKNKKIILIQIRSRDDTGGTTAKGSLVDFLRYLLRQNKKTDYSLTYLIAVWDKRNQQQKHSTITKIYSALKENINVTENDFQKNISNGIKITNKITLKLAYGTDEIADALFLWNKSRNRKILNSIKNITKTITKWDDLWIPYSISSLEIELNSFYNISNFNILSNFLKQEKFDLNINSLNNIALNISTIWKENTIPLPSVSDKILYIRDLLYLKLIYNKIIL